MAEKASSLPSAKSLDEWYEFIFKLFNEPRSRRMRSARSRFQVAESVFDRLRFFYSDLSRILVAYEFAVRESEYLPTKEERSIALAAATNTFLEQRKLRKVDRGEFKLFVDSLLFSITDIDEARFFNAVAWFFQYSDSISYHRLDIHKIIHGPRRNGERGADQRWDSASGWLGAKVRSERSSKKIISHIEEAKIAVSSRFTEVVMTFNDLQMSLGFFPEAEPERDSK
jgi:hypothetical protein